MKFGINKDFEETLELPAIVINKLSQTTEAAVRVVLYVLYYQTTESNEISNALNLSIDEVNKALLFWCGAGLLYFQGNTQSLPNVEETQTEADNPPLKRNKNESVEQRKPDIVALLEECQHLFNESLSPAEINILISLHENEGLPVDLILIGITHLVQNGKRNMRYIERRLLNWKKEGTTTRDGAESRFSFLEMEPEREQYVAALLGINTDLLTLTERKLIKAWYNDFKFDDEMIYQAYLRTGLNRSIRYMNGILRNWNSKNIRTPKNIEDKPQNVVLSSTTKHNPNDYVTKKMYQVPKLKKKDE